MHFTRSVAIFNVLEALLSILVNIPYQAYQLLVGLLLGWDLIVHCNPPESMFCPVSRPELLPFTCKKRKASTSITIKCPLTSLTDLGAYYNNCPTWPLLLFLLLSSLLLSGSTVPRSLPVDILTTALVHKWNFFFFFAFLGAHLQHMEVPKLGVQSELKLLAYITAIAMQESKLRLQPTPQLLATPDP